jgi:hypothetical protein
MAQESNAETPAAAAVTTLRQKSREGETSFTFHADRLDFVFAGRQGTRIERRIPWTAVPPLSGLRRNARPDARFHRVIRISVIVLIFLFAARYAAHAGALLLAAGYTVVLCGLTLLLSRRFRIVHSILPTRDGNIVVLGDAAHDAVLTRLMDARRAYFRRFAAIDRARSVRWNLQRLRWMLEQDVIGKEEFVRAQQALLPGVRQPLLRQAAETGPDLRIDQHFFNALFSFDFRADHLAYRRRSGLGIEHALTVKYLDLQEPTTEVQVGTPSQLVPSVTFWFVIIGFGYMLEMFGRFPGWTFAGPEGLQRGLFVFAPGLAGVALAILAARRIMRMVTTKLPLDIMILRDRQHDAIFAELQRRRHAALKAMAEPDPLLPAAEQANVLAVLRERGIIDTQEVPVLIARAAALQQHLGLTDPAPGDDAAMPDEAPAPHPAPRPTIH